MRIVIPTKGRAFRQITLSQLPRSLLHMTDVVCAGEREGRDLAHQWDSRGICIHEEPHDMTIAQKRKWIIEKWVVDDEKIFFMDDDLYFFTRKNSEETGLRPLRLQEWEDIFNLVEQKLGPECPIVGLGIRQGNNRKLAGWESPGKSMMTMAMHLPTILKLCELGRIEFREDYDYILQILRKGYPNAVYNTVCANQAAFGARGGCSTYRTMESSNKDAERLAELHPGFVKVVRKEFKSLPRTEVMCYWKKALAAGQEERAKNENINSA